MAHDSLTKVYRQNRNSYEDIYTLRYNSVGAKHFDIVIRQFNRRNAYPIPCSSRFNKIAELRLSAFCRLYLS